MYNVCSAVHLYSVQVDEETGREGTDHFDNVNWASHNLIKKQGVKQEEKFRFVFVRLKTFIPVNFFFNLLYFYHYQIHKT